MLALRLEKFGDPKDLKLTDIPAPQPGADEALVRVRAAALNPSDLGNVMGRFQQTKPPRTIGRDFAGVVEQGPPQWKGAEVFGTGGDIGFTRDGSNAELLAVPVAALTRKPAAFSMEQAASAGVVYITAYSALTLAKLQKGETLLIIGAGGVGHAATRIGKWRGATTILVAKDHSDANHARSIGADHVLTSDSSDLPQQVKDLTAGRGAAAAFNTVGGPTFEPSLQSLAPGGRMTVIAANVNKRVEFDLMQFYRNQWQLFGLNTSHLDAVACARLLQEMADGLASGVLTPLPIGETYPLKDAVTAYQRQAEKKVKGKIVLTMG